MNQCNTNTSVKSNDPVARLELTLESFECAKLIVKLTEQNDSLQRMLEIAHIEAQKSKKQIAAMSHFNSHAVRGALTRIWGLSNVIRQSKNMEEVQRLVNLLQQGSFMS